MLHQNDEARHASYYYVDLRDATSAERSLDKPMRLTTKDGVCYSACINCHQPRCLRYYEGEYGCNDFDNFAERQDDRVCAFDAISWSNERQAITIDEDACIGCGICASRCPLGALYMDMDRGRMAVNLDREKKPFKVVCSTECAPTYQDECVDRIMGMPVEHVKDQRVLERVRHVYQRLDEVGASREAASLLCRNLMIGAGTNCALRRTGVPSTRMDAVYSSAEASGAIEIEFQSDSLSVARNLLDDVAMMQVRMGLPMDGNTPLAIYARVPNTRQDYYQVCDDVHKVLGLRVRTLTMAALLMLVWGGAKLDLGTDRFCLGFRDTSIREDVESLLGYRLSGSGKDFAGFLKPDK